MPDNPKLLKKPDEWGRATINLGQALLALAEDHAAAKMQSLSAYCAELIANDLKSLKPSPAGLEAALREDMLMRMRNSRRRKGGDATPPSAT